MRTNLISGWCRLACGAALMLTLSLVMQSLQAQTAQVPQSGGRITRILVGFPPGQATDSVARLIAERLTAALGYSVIVENRPGQGGSIVLSQLAKSPADGSVLSMSALAAYVVNPYLYKNVSYDSARDFDPVALVADLPLVLVANPSAPVNSLRELIAYAKANPGKLAFSSSGSGTLSHLLMEDLKQRAGINLMHVPYQGSPRAMVDLMAGNVQIGLDTLTVTQPQVRAGKLKILAAGTLTRLAGYPDVPTISEQGFPGFAGAAWIALTAPAGTPKELREKINAEVNRALNSPEFAEKMLAMGAIPRPASTAEFGAFIKAEQKRWKEVVERSGAKAE